MSNLFRIFFLLSIIGLSSCSYLNNKKPADDKVIAEVNTKALHLSDLEGIVPRGMSGEDSALIASAYVQRWAKEALMQQEAEKNLPRDVDIDQLVRDYRASLLRFNYEEYLMEEKLDSTIAESELQAYYEANKDQFQLDNTILRIQILKVPNDAPLAEFNTLWNSQKEEDKKALIELASKWASFTMLEEETWHTLKSIQNRLPDDALTKNNVSKRKEGTLKDDISTYYFRVLEFVHDKQPAPYEYARDQALKVLLHRRKQKLMEDLKESLYQEALQQKKVKIY